MIPNGDRGKGFGLRASLELDKHPEGQRSEVVAKCPSGKAARCLTKILGIGTINATALAAAVGDARAFRRGRDMAAWLGPTPLQMTTGGKPRLLGISKRGNRILRKNLIRGARAAKGALRALGGKMFDHRE